MSDDQTIWSVALAEYLAKCDFDDIFCPRIVSEVGRVLKVTPTSGLQVVRGNDVYEIHRVDAYKGRRVVQFNEYVFTFDLLNNDKIHARLILAYDKVDELLFVRHAPQITARSPA